MFLFVFEAKHRRRLPEIFQVSGSSLSEPSVVRLVFVWKVYGLNLGVSLDAHRQRDLIVGWNLVDVAKFATLKFPPSLRIIQTSRFITFRIRAYSCARGTSSTGPATLG